PHRVEERDRARPLRPGLRGGLRGHAAAGARPDPPEGPDRIRAEGPPRRDPRQGDRILRVGQGPHLTPSDPASTRGLFSNLRKLATHSAVYGAADVFTNVVTVLLLPLYIRFLTPEDIGNLALLILFSTFAKVVFRLGLDAGFFRIHYGLKTEAERRALAGTVSLFAAGVGALLLAAMAAAARPITGWLFGATPVPTSWVVLVAGDVALGTLAFGPLALLRV